MFADQPSWQSLQQLTRMMYGEQHPIALDVAGTRDSVHLITSDLLYEAYNTHYVTSQMSVSVIGPVDTENIIDILEQFPARGECGAADKYALKFHPATALEHNKQRYVEIEMGLPLPLIRLGFRADTCMSLTEQVACMIGIEALLGDTSDFQANGLKSGFLHSGEHGIIITARSLHSAPCAVIPPILFLCITSLRIYVKIFRRERSLQFVWNMHE